MDTDTVWRAGMGTGSLPTFIVRSRLTELLELLLRTYCCYKIFSSTSIEIDCIFLVHRDKAKTHTEVLTAATTVRFWFPFASTTGFKQL
jgi:hypothetical protein